jgi:hypothetical protein
MLLDFSAEAVSVRAAPDAAPVVLSRAWLSFRTAPHLEWFANPFGKLSCSA